jgi:hypothetical protein
MVNPSPWTKSMRSFSRAGTASTDSVFRISLPRLVGHGGRSYRYCDITPSFPERSLGARPDCCWEGLSTAIREPEALAAVDAGVWVCPYLGRQSPRTCIIPASLLPRVAPIASLNCISPRGIVDSVKEKV